MYVRLSYPLWDESKDRLHIYYLIIADTYWFASILRDNSTFSPKDNFWLKLSPSIIQKVLFLWQQFSVVINVFYNFILCDHWFVIHCYLQWKLSKTKSYEAAHLSRHSFYIYLYFQWHAVMVKVGSNDCTTIFRQQQFRTLLHLFFL